MFPSLELDSVSSSETNEDEFGTSFLFDFNEGDFIVKDGKLVKAESLEAIQVWIEKILRTEKFKSEIYSKDGQEEYGATIRSLIMGKKFPVYFLQSELKREITEALQNHPKISSISDLATEQNGYELRISLTVNLVDGETLDTEVNI